MLNKLFLTLDLNLLRTFWVLSQELSTTKTAKRLGLSQPAISRALQRLREHFADELFVKSYQGLAPTAKGQHLIEALLPIMAQLSDVINQHEDVDLTKMQGRIRIAMHPFLCLALGQDIFQQIHNIAPNLAVDLVSWNQQTAEQIKNDEVQIGLNFSPMEVSKEIAQKPLGKDIPSIYLRKDHPFKGKYIRLADIHKYDMLALILPGWTDNQTLAEQYLANFGITLNVVFRTELPQVAFDTLAKSDMLMPGSGLLQAGLRDDIRSLPIDPSIPLPEWELGLFYHYRHRSNPAYRFFFSAINQALKTAKSKI